MGYYGYIYYTQNIVNNKSYVGQSTRFSRYLNNYLGSGSYLAKAINKYGRESFTKKILAYYSSQEELDNAERMYIAILSPEYNIDIGGTGKGKHSLETKEKIRKANEGRKHSLESRHNMSEAHKGKILNEESKKKLSSALKQVEHTAEWNAKISSSSKGRVPTDQCRLARIAAYSIAVSCIELKASFESAAEASLFVMGSTEGRSNIGLACRGIRQKAYGYHWKYVDELRSDENTIIPSSTAINTSAV